METGGTVRMRSYTWRIKWASENEMVDRASDSCIRNMAVGRQNADREEQIAIPPSEDLINRRPKGV